MTHAVMLTKEQTAEAIDKVAKSDAFRPKGYFSPVQKQVITEVAMALLIETGLIEIVED